MQPPAPAAPPASVPVPPRRPPPKSGARPQQVTNWTSLWGSKWQPGADVHRVGHRTVTPRTAARQAQRAAEAAAEQQRLDRLEAQRMERAREEAADFEARAARALHQSWAWQPAALLRLTNLDRTLRDALASKKVRILRAAWLLSRPAGWRLPRRQQLEQLEKQGQQPYLSPKEATCWLECGRRQIGTLSAGWLSHVHPDPDGSRLAAVKRYLAGDPQAVGLFWDYACLPMRPRTAAEDALFGSGLSVMADLYASPVGTFTLVCEHAPPLPARFQGACYIGGLAAGTSGGAASNGASAEGAADDINALRAASLRSVLSAYGPILELRLSAAGDTALVRYDSHKHARRAVEQAQVALQRAVGLPGVWMDLYYRERPAIGRGWMVFERGLSEHALHVVGGDSAMAKALDALERPKIVELAVDGAPIVHSAKEPTGGETAGSRSTVQRQALDLTARIERARFTVPSDKAAVISRLAEYSEGLNAALSSPQAGRVFVETQSVPYEGERNSKGEPEGHGTLQLDGELYEGSFVAGLRDGYGRQTYLDGSVYMGSWQGGMRHGDGMLTAASGKERFIGQWQRDLRHGPGCVETFMVCKIDVGAGAGKRSVHSGEGSDDEDDKEGGGGGARGGGGVFGSVTQDVLEWRVTWKGEYLYDTRADRRTSSDGPQELRRMLNDMVPVSKLDK